MGLHIHHGSHLVELTESLAALLSVALPDPFTAEVLAVPTAGIRDWLQQQLALRLGTTIGHDGVSANIEMLFPSRFVARALGRPAHVDDPWDIDHLTWAVLTALESGAVIVPGYTTRAAPHPITAHTRYATARRITDLFDRYANNRPAMLHQWYLGHDGDGTLDERGAVVPLDDDQRWQPALWRQVRKLIAVPNHAELMPQLLASLAAGQLSPQLPQRVAVFGVSAISPGQLSVLSALSHVRDVHVYLVHPSAIAWQNCKQRLHGALTLRSGCDATAAVQHRLVRSWARPAMEAVALLGGLDADQQLHRHPLHELTNGSTALLLHQLQADIAADREPLGGRAHIRDDSVQIHACHGTTRQLEVLRDALGHAFANDATLAPHDVVIVCPDLARFAPLIASVFQRGIFPVPVQVSDLSLGASNPVATALSTLLELASGRCTASDLLGLCALTPIRLKLGLTDDDVARIDQWVTDLGVTWGLDAEHRSQWVPEHITEGTWTSALDRLLLGAAMPSPVPRVGPGDIVAFDDVSTDGLRTAGLLAELIALLRAVRRDSSGEHNIRVWADTLTTVVGSICATSPDDAWQLAEVLQAIAGLRDQSMIAGAPCNVGLSLSDIRSLLSALISQRHGRLSLRSGAVTVTAMVPVRNIPARAVCVLGLDEGSLRSAGSDGDDILGWHPCVGERDQRVEGRHLLLDALMAAGDLLVITYDGSDITTNRPLPLTVQLMELLDIVTATLTPAPAHHSDPNAAAEAIVLTRHPRQAYDERNFVEASQSPGPLSDSPVRSPFGFDNTMMAAALARRHSSMVAAGSDAMSPAGPLPLAVPELVTLQQLAESSARPARTYLVDRLDVRLPGSAEEIANDIPIEIASLESWRLGADLLQQHRSTASPEQIQQWRTTQQLSGALPPRALAQSALTDIEHEVERMLESDPDLITLIAQSGTEAIDIRVNAAGRAPCTARLIDTLNNVAGDTLVRVDFCRPGPFFKIRAALELAAAVVAQPGRQWNAILVNRAPAKSKPKPLYLAPVPTPERVDAAQHLLDIAFDLRLQALCEPLPLFEWSSLKLYESGRFDDATFADDLRNEHTSFLWGSLTAEDITAPTGNGRAEALAQTLWGAYHSFIVESPP